MSRAPLPGAAAAPHRQQRPATRIRRWVLLCATAEAVGMSASAVAARTAGALDGGALAAWGVIVLGGLVEGTAVGLAQSTALRPLAPSLDRRRWLPVTVAVAGLGWAAASAPSALGTGDGTAGPPLFVVMIAAAGLGVSMGVLLGTAQAWVLRGAVGRPRRWIGVSAAAWAPAMVVVFVGASLAPAGWSAGAVAGLGAATGAVAGSLLGAICGLLVPALAAPPR